MLAGNARWHGRPRIQLGGRGGRPRGRCRAPVCCAPGVERGNRRAPPDVRFADVAIKGREGSRGVRGVEGRRVPLGHQVGLGCVCGVGLRRRDPLIPVVGVVVRRHELTLSGEFQDAGGGRRVGLRGIRAREDVLETRRPRVMLLAVRPPRVLPIVMERLVGRGGWAERT